MLFEVLLVLLFLKSVNYRLNKRQKVGRPIYTFVDSLRKDLQKYVPLGIELNEWDELYDDRNLIKSTTSTLYKRDDLNDDEMSDDLLLYIGEHSAIENARNIFKTHNLINEICEKINLMINEGWNIKILWVPSHCNIEDNEKADELAKGAHEKPDETVEIPVHFLECAKNYEHDVIASKWQKMWKNSDKGRFCFSIIPKISKQPWYKNTKFSRRDITFWNRIISNHTRSAHSLNRFNIVESPVCNCAQNYETVDHMVFECKETSDSKM